MCPNSILHTRSDCPPEHVTHILPDGTRVCDDHGVPWRQRAVVAFIPVGKGVLAVTRKDNHDDWGLPGGKVEGTDANDWAAIKREVLEETGCWLHWPIPLYSVWYDGRLVTVFTGDVPDSHIKGISLRTNSEGAVIDIVAPQQLIDKSCFGEYNAALFKRFPFM